MGNVGLVVHCDIVSAEENLFSGQVERVVASGILGDLGIEPGHAALITPLQPGPVRIVKQNGEEEIVYKNESLSDYKKKFSKYFNAFELFFSLELLNASP